MERFERVQAFPGTYFEILPLDLRKLLVLYIYQCNFNIRIDRPQIYEKIYIYTKLHIYDVGKGIHYTIRLEKISIPDLENLIKFIALGQSIEIRGTDLHIIYSGFDLDLYIRSYMIELYIPLCKELINTLIELNKFRK